MVAFLWCFCSLWASLTFANATCLQMQTKTVLRRQLLRLKHLLRHHHHRTHNGARWPSAHWKGNRKQSVCKYVTKTSLFCFWQAWNHTYGWKCITALGLRTTEFMVTSKKRMWNNNAKSLDRPPPPTSATKHNLWWEPLALAHETLAGGHDSLLGDRHPNQQTSELRIPPVYSKLTKIRSI